MSVDYFICEDERSGEMSGDKKNETEFHFHLHKTLTNNVSFYLTCLSIGNDEIKLLNQTLQWRTKNFLSEPQRKNFQISHNYSPEIQVALYPNVSMEINESRDQEGIPYMRILGIWARILVDDIKHFCRLYRYRNGRYVTSVHTYGGYIWEGYPALECLSNGDDQCLDVSELILSSRWYDGPYIVCTNDDNSFILNGEYSTCVILPPILWSNVLTSKRRLLHYFCNTVGSWPVLPTSPSVRGILDIAQ